MIEIITEQHFSKVLY